MTEETTVVDLLEAVAGISGLALMGVGFGAILYKLATLVTIPLEWQVFFAGSLMFFGAWGMSAVRKRTNRTTDE